MKVASRESMAVARERLDALVGREKAPALRQLGDELFAVVELLDAEPVLRRHLADASAEQQARAGLAEAVLAGKVGDHALAAVRDAVTEHWAEPVDLVDAMETLARLATLAESEKDGTLEEVEDELFRFGRILDGQPRLRVLLADPTAPPERRVELLDGLVEGKVRPVTARLLRQAVRAPRGRSLDRVAENLAELAAARRDRYVAHVTAAGPLSAEQQDHLVRTLGTIYQRDISLQVEIDPDIQGGLVVRVGEEIIDGSVSGRLDEARQRLDG